jgi:hypothetical protein
VRQLLQTRRGLRVQSGTDARESNPQNTASGEGRSRPYPGSSREAIRLPTMALASNPKTPYRYRSCHGLMPRASCTAPACWVSVRWPPDSTRPRPALFIRDVVAS